MVMLHLDCTTLQQAKAETVGIGIVVEKVSKMDDKDWKRLV